MVGVIILVSAIIYVALISAVRIGTLLGPTRVKVVTRLMAHHRAGE